MVVWKSFHAARPRSAFRVSFPRFPMMASPLRVDSWTSMGWMGVRLGLLLRLV